MIRNADKTDVQTMVDMAAAMHAESKFRAFNFNPEKLSAEISALIELQRGVVLIAEEDGATVGGFLGFLTEHFFGDDLVASDWGLFVKPEHRNSKHALDLVQAYVEQAKQKGAAEITIGTSTGVNTEHAARLFEHIGFQRDGYLFSMKAGA